MAVMDDLLLYLKSFFKKKKPTKKWILKPGRLAPAGTMGTEDTSTCWKIKYENISTLNKKSLQNRPHLHQMIMPKKTKTLFI